MTDTTHPLSAGLVSPDAATLDAAHLSQSFDARLAVLDLIDHSDRGEDRVETFSRGMKAGA